MDPKSFQTKEDANPIKGFIKAYLKGNAGNEVANRKCWLTYKLMDEFVQ